MKINRIPISKEEDVANDHVDAMFIRLDDDQFYCELVLTVRNIINIGSTSVFVSSNLF